MPRKPPTEKPPRPDDEVRLVVRLPREDRAKLKGFAAKLGEDMEDMAHRWLLERLAQEDRKR
jgi:hypothetical protein